VNAMGREWSKGLSRFGIYGPSVKLSREAQNFQGGSQPQSKFRFASEYNNLIAKT